MVLWGRYAIRLSVATAAQDLRELEYHLRLSLVWADGGYAGQLVQWLEPFCHWTLQIVKLCEKATGFHVLPRRWVVERTFGWIGRCRRLSKDYEADPHNSQAMVYIAMIQLMLRRLTCPSAGPQLEVA